MNAPIPNPVYRVYILAPDGGILRAHDLDCETDEQAIRSAQTHAAGNAVELWDKSRKIAAIPMNHQVE